MARGGEEEEEQSSSQKAEQLEDLSDTDFVGVTAQQVEQGADVQGIQWRQGPGDRQLYRGIRRLEQYFNRAEEVEESKAYVEQARVKQAQGSFYSFRRSTPEVNAHITHFQLRNLLYVTPLGAFFVENSCVRRFDPASGAIKTVLDLTGHGDPRTRAFGRVQVSTCAARGRLVAAGGFLGELAVAWLGPYALEDDPGGSAGADVVLSQPLATGENAITNALELADAGLLAASNDERVRAVDLTAAQAVRSIPVEWAPNQATRCPGQPQHVLVAGDDPTACLLDLRQREPVVCQLQGHVDFSFAAAWHPSKLWECATGNQDTTTRVWDIRQPSREAHLLKSESGAVRALRYSPDGRFLATSEPADFICLHSTEDGYARKQVIDLFGEVAGISFDSTRFFIAISDPTIGSLLEYSSDEGLGV